MATSGQVKTNTAYDSYFWVRWSQKSQNIEANKTTISWSCGVTCGHSFYSNAIKWTEALYINGSLVYGGGTYSNFSNGEHTLASGQLDIAHGTDGKKKFSVSAFSGWLYSSYNYYAAATEYELPTIPRAASITGADNFTDTGNPTITYSNPAGDAVTALEACISLTTAETDGISYRSITKTGSSYTFSLTDAERNILRNNTPGTSRTVYFYVRTKIGSSVFRSSIAKTFTMTSNSATKPAVSITASLNNGNLPSKFGSLYIQGKSRVNISVSGTGKYGATIKDRYAVVAGKTYKSNNFTSDVLTGSGNVTITGYAVDSRGFTGAASSTVNVVAYAKPLVVPASNENAILCYRSDVTGRKTNTSTSVLIKAKRSYYTINGKNTCKLQWRMKPASSKWNDATHTWSDLIPNTTTSTDEYNALLPDVVFEKTNAYTVQIRAIDDIGEYDIKTFDVPTEDVALHLGKGGKNVSVGSYCDYSEEYTFHSEWDCKFDKNLSVGGSINNAYIRVARIWGTNTIRLQSRFDAWGGDGGSRQSFFVIGCTYLGPIRGVISVNNKDNVAWDGTAGISVNQASGGVVEIVLPTIAYDHFLILSPQIFEVI